MKVALLSDGIYPYQVGGMQKHSYYLAKFLAQSGIEVDLYHTVLDGRENQEVDCFSEDEMKFITPFFIPFPSVAIRFPGHYIYRNYLYSRQVLEAVEGREMPDYFYIQGFSGWATLEKASKQKMPPSVVNFHGLNMFQASSSISLWASTLLLKKPAERNLKNASYVISLGGSLTKLLKRIVSKEKILEIPIGIDRKWTAEVGSIPPCNNRFRRFLFVGRYDRVKGIEELSASLRKVLGDSSEFEFHFVGDIPEGKQLKHERIIYHGLIRSEDKMREIFSQSDVFVSASHSEGMPTVILEAMASSLAVIATNVGAVSEQVSEENGWLIEANNQSQLENALRQAASLPAEELIQMKQSSKRKLEENFLWEQVIEKQNRIIGDALGL